MTKYKPIRQGRRLFSALAAFPILCLALASSRPTIAQQNPLRFEVGPVFSEYHAPALSRAVTGQLQLGGRFTWNWLPHLSFEGEYASSLKKPGAESQNDGGYFSQALFGVKSGFRWQRWGIFAKFRPGFVSYSGAITSANQGSVTTPVTFGRLNEAAYDLGGGAEFILSRHWLFRYDASDLITHVGNRPFLLNGQQLTFLPITTHNFETEVSVAFRF